MRGRLSIVLIGSLLVLAIAAQYGCRATSLARGVQAESRRLVFKTGDVIQLDFGKGLPNAARGETTVAAAGDQRLLYTEKRVFYLANGLLEPQVFTGLGDGDKIKYATTSDWKTFIICKTSDETRFGKELRCYEGSWETERFAFRSSIDEEVSAPFIDKFSAWNSDGHPKIEWLGPKTFATRDTCSWFLENGGPRAPIHPRDKRSLLPAMAKSSPTEVSSIYDLACEGDHSPAWLGTAMVNTDNGIVGPAAHFLKDPSEVIVELSKSDKPSIPVYRPVAWFSGMDCGRVILIHNVLGRLILSICDVVKATPNPVTMTWGGRVHRNSFELKERIIAPDYSGFSRGSRAAPRKNAGSMDESTSTITARWHPRQLTRGQTNILRVPSAASESPEGAPFRGVVEILSINTSDTKDSFEFSNFLFHVEDWSEILGLYDGPVNGTFLVTGRRRNSDGAFLSLITTGVHGMGVESDSIAFKGEILDVIYDKLDRHSYAIVLKNSAGNALSLSTISLRPAAD